MKFYEYYANVYISWTCFYKQAILLTNILFSQAWAGAVGGLIEQISLERFQQHISNFYLKLHSPEPMGSLGAYNIRLENIFRLTEKAF